MEAESDFYIEMTFLKTFLLCRFSASKVWEWCKEGGPRSKKVIMLLVQLSVNPEEGKKR